MGLKAEMKTAKQFFDKFGKEGAEKKCDDYINFNKSRKFTSIQEMWERIKEHIKNLKDD